MHWLADLMAAIGVVLNGIPQGIMAMGLGFAVFPTTFSFLLVAALNFLFHSVAPVSFQAESLALTGSLGRDTSEFTSIIFGGSVIMAIIGFTGMLPQIVYLLGNHIITAMMAGVGIMLAKIALNMSRTHQKSLAGWVSIAVAVITYLISHDLVWTICLSVILSSLYAVLVEHYHAELPAIVTARKFVLTKPHFNQRVLRGALSLACLNIGANLSYGLITGQMTGIKPNPVNLNLLTSSQALADMGTSLLGGAPVETIISATASAPEPVIAGCLMMLIMAVILFSGWLPKIGRFVPSASIAGFLFVLGVFVTFPENATAALAGKEQLAATATMLLTALVDPFVGLLAGGFLKIVVPLLALL
ncbi:NCS2 family permease [Lactobacillus helveticus]|uniref:NCS2 family permease n=1 Tax=Lactobacillus helveticus TaxID=1587 RepID=UPI002182229B|nr:NCS2 family permease [Lactobacillus helveticus]MCT0197016.1 NCS2 family permease [Lactobacillus helveticus]